MCKETKQKQPISLIVQLQQKECFPTKTLSKAFGATCNLADQNNANMPEKVNSRVQH